MACDWIKMRSNLWDDPRVSAVCDATGQGEAAIVGGLFRLWSIADQHSADGRLMALSGKALDRKTGIEGFSVALEAVGWLVDGDDGLYVPEFDKHNSRTAKRRAEESRRKGQSRADSADDGGDPSAIRPQVVRKMSATVRTNPGQIPDKLRN